MTHYWFSQPTSTELLMLLAQVSHTDWRQKGNKSGRFCTNTFFFYHFHTCRSNMHAGEPHFLYNVKCTRYTDIRYTFTVKGEYTCNYASVI